jgi:hypothetical protein
MINNKINMSLSLDPEKTSSIPIAVIKDSYEYGGEIVYLNSIVPGEELEEEETSMNLDDGKFTPMINPQNKSNVFYICAPRGSGKTTLSVEIGENYNMIYPDRPIYLFTETANSELNKGIYKRLQNLRVMKLDETIITHPIKTEELASSLVIFDDFGTLPDVLIQEPGKKKKTKFNLTTAVRALRDVIIQNGRHDSIDCIICTHMLFEYSKSRNVLEELNYLVYFKDSGITHVKRYLNNNLGLEAKDIKKLTTRPSRWVMVCKNSPRYFMTENEIGII